MNKKKILNIIAVFSIIAIMCVVGIFTYNTYMYAKTLETENSDLHLKNEETYTSIETLKNEYDTLSSQKDALITNKNSLQSKNDELVTQVSNLEDTLSGADDYVYSLYCELEQTEETWEPVTDETKAMLDEIEHLTYLDSTPERQARLFLYAFHYVIPQEVKDDFFNEGYTIQLSGERQGRDGYIMLNPGCGIVLYQVQNSYSYMLCHEFGHYIDVRTRALDGSLMNAFTYDTASQKSEFTDAYNKEINAPFEDYIKTSYHKKRIEFFSDSYAIYELHYDKYKDSHPLTFEFIDERLKAFR